MTEQERLMVLNRIEEDKQKLQRRKELTEEIRKMEQEELINLYKNLLNERRKLTVVSSTFNNDLEEAQYYEFIWAFSSKSKGKEFSDCDNPLWLYLGSYAVSDDPYNRCAEDYRVLNEQDKNFSFNKYGCIECGKKIKVRDWQKFENVNVVGPKHAIGSLDYYQKMYYQLLLDNTVETAREKMLLKLDRK